MESFWPLIWNAPSGYFDITWLHDNRETLNNTWTATATWKVTWSINITRVALTESVVTLDMGCPKPPLGDHATLEKLEPSITGWYTPGNLVRRSAQSLTRMPKRVSNDSIFSRLRRSCRTQTESRHVLKWSLTTKLTLVKTRWPCFAAK